MPCDLYLVLGLRLVAGGKGADPEHLVGAAADAVHVRVVVAGEPDPVAAALQCGKVRAVLLGETAGPLAVMEAVAERDQRLRGKARDHVGKAQERRRSVVGRQQLAARCKARALLEVQIGDDEDFLFRPVERAGGIGRETGAGELDLNAAYRPRVARWVQEWPPAPISRPI